MQQVRWLHLSKIEQLLYVEDLNGHLVLSFVMSCGRMSPSCVLDLTLAQEVTANLDLHTGACDPHCGMYTAVN
jgi:hypothetical protein